ncbi:MAG: exodeoxyribonuclease V subunit beta [Arsenophonus sp.]|nr:MAG: exodeoxyribonuclease V subunit beta [Arsenophonus sp.]
MNINYLNPFTLSLKKRVLIEASAGTGKTYNIVIIYLRLLLGQRESSSLFKFNVPLDVSEILVLTFTENAKDELLVRIKKSIRKLRKACINETKCFDESIYQTILSKIRNKKIAFQLLSLAEINISHASIYTIHGFCRRILSEFFFELKIPSKYSILNNEEHIEKQACMDFWRRFLYPLDYSICNNVFQCFKNPQELLSVIKPYLYGELPLFFNKELIYESIEKYHIRIINNINKFKKTWLKYSSKMIDILMNVLILNRRIYNLHNLNIWIENINIWAKQNTLDYNIPSILFYFSKTKISTLIKENFSDLNQYHIFSEIDHILKKKYTLKNILIVKSIFFVRKKIYQKKISNRTFGFDDLLSILDYNLLDKKNNLGKIIQRKYPMIIVDEFQDTDLRQYRILSNIYQNKEYTGLFLFADPKQSIYSFRDANIFVYIKAKKEIKNVYFLKENWRSSKDMIESINKLFMYKKNVFLFQDIPFYKVYPSNLSKKLKIYSKNNKISALNFYYLDYKKYKNIDLKEIIADYCASHIYNYLYFNNNDIVLCKNNISNKIKHSDIIILVRNYSESLIIKKSLEKFNITTQIISEIVNIFQTAEAYDLVLILNAIIYPDNNNFLRTALATRLIGLSINEICYLNENEIAWSKKISNFFNYLNLWNENGISIMLKTIISDYEIVSNLLKDEINGKKRLMNLFQLIEILEEQSLLFYDKYSLIQWLIKKIYNSEFDEKYQQIFSEESNKKIIRITTIHKSKGLEFPIVWIPFGCSVFKKNICSFHQKDNLRSTIDFYPSQDELSISYKEYLSEEIRLLYVAMTRSIFCCHVGILFNIKKKNRTLLFYRNVLEYIFNFNLNDQNKSFEKSIKKLSSDVISFFSIQEQDIKLISLINKKINLNQKNKFKHNTFIKDNLSKFLSEKKFSRFIDNDSQIISYSKLKNDTNLNILNEKNLFSSEISYFFKNSFKKKQIKKNNLYSIHTFPKGLHTGIFFHHLLEKIYFNKRVNKFWLLKKIKIFGFEINWISILKRWLFNILNTPLLKNGLMLSKIKSNEKLKEIFFHFSINNQIECNELNKIIKKYDHLSRLASLLTFKKVSGILKGSIDLICLWKNKFYIIDYKTNWLGDNTLKYNFKNIKSEMIKNRYDIQYQFYTLALHRYLQYRLKKYSYNKNFGGVIYVFLRGINPKYLGYGIYHVIPSFKLIKELDIFFKNRI